jgi:hypothetical protein
MPTYKDLKISREVHDELESIKKDLDKYNLSKSFFYDYIVKEGCEIVNKDPDVFEYITDNNVKLTFTTAPKDKKPESYSLSEIPGLDIKNLYDSFEKETIYISGEVSKKFDKLWSSYNDKFHFIQFPTLVIKAGLEAFKSNLPELSSI